MYNINQLKELRNKEYETLQELIEIRVYYKKRGDDKMVASCDHSITWQQGRWGMLDDMIEELEKGESQND